MTASKLHLLPEAYIYGLADTKISAGDLPSYLFGRDYPGAPHWYFPAAFLIKSTLPFLIMLGLTVAVVFRGRWQMRREIIFLTVPPIFIFLLSTASNLGIGYRHLFPMFPMLYILIAGCARTSSQKIRNSPMDSLFYCSGSASRRWLHARDCWPMQMRPGAGHRRRIFISPTPIRTGASNSEPSKLTSMRTHRNPATLPTSHRGRSILRTMESTAMCCRQDRRYGLASIPCASVKIRTYRARC